MERVYVVLTCALGLSGCITQASVPTPTPEPPAARRNLKPAQATGEAKDRVTSSLKNDPESARFTNVSFKAKQSDAQGHPTDVVCGHVNFKDASGTYSGPRPFVYLVDRRSVVLLESDADNGMSALQTFCQVGLASR